MTSVYRGYETDQIVDGMIANMKFQIESPALLNSRFVFDEFLYLDVNFHQLNLTRGSSYLPLPDYVRDLYKKLSENIGETPEEFHYDYFKLENRELYYRGSRKPLTTKGVLKLFGMLADIVGKIDFAI